MIKEYKIRWCKSVCEVAERIDEKKKQKEKEKEIEIEIEIEIEKV